MPKGFAKDAVDGHAGRLVGFQLLWSPACFVFLHQVGRAHHLHTAPAHQFDGASIHHGHIRNCVSRRILHGHVLGAAENFPYIPAEFILPRVVRSLARQRGKRLRLDLVHQFLWCSLRRNEIKPSSRPHRRRQVQDVLGNGIAPSKIVKEPAVDFGGPQVALDTLNLRAHGEFAPSPSHESKLLRQASSIINSRISRRVTPLISMRFVRFLSPPRILTADLGLFKSRARSSTSASFARFSTAGARSRTFSAPPSSPAISSLLARGCTRTEKITAPSLSCASSMSCSTGNYPVFRVPNKAVPTRSSVAPSSMATSKSCDIPIDRTGRLRPSDPATRLRNSASRRKYGRVFSACSKNGGMHMSPASSNRGSPAIFSAKAGSPAVSTPLLV